MLKFKRIEPECHGRALYIRRAYACIFPLVILVFYNRGIDHRTSWGQIYQTKSYPIESVINRENLIPAENKFLHFTPLFPMQYPVKLTSFLSHSDTTYEYIAQSGDTIHSVAAHFRVRPQEITSNDTILPNVLLTPGQILYIPRMSDEFPNTQHLLPDSEVIFSASAADFDVTAYIDSAAGYLSEQQEFMRSSGMTSVAEIIERIALENSFNPRLLLALLEYQCGCVLGYPGNDFDTNYLMGFQSPVKRGLYRQLGWAVNQLSLGYYGWRDGLISEFYFPNGTVTRIPPTLNAGSVALQYLFAQLYDSDDWQRAVDPDEGLSALYIRMFGDPWQRDENLAPLLPGNLSQPEMILPFHPGEIWSYTSGPHKAWETDGALAALDFAPPSVESGCMASDEWIVAVADGLVVRSEYGAVVLDLDATGNNENLLSTYSDANELTGWAILYMHVAQIDRVPEGVHLRAGDPIGHPSCEGGPASGTHVHIARKYNGEWIAADGPVPFVMDGWVAKSGYKPFEGTLVKDDITITANFFSPGYSFISRDVAEISRLKRILRQNQLRRWKCD